VVQIKTLKAIMFQSITSKITHEIDLFIPCFIDQFNPQTGFNMDKA